WFAGARYGRAPRWGTLSWGTLCSGALCCAALWGCEARSSGHEAAAPVSILQEVPEAKQVGNAFVSVAERLAPSVVRITIREPVEGRLSGPAFGPFQGTPF